MSNNSQRIWIGDVWVTPITQSELHTAILKAVRERVQHKIMHINARAVALARRERAFREALQQADIVFCDGYGVKLAARLLGQELPERVTYADWIYPFAAFSSAHRLRWFLLGAQPGVADAAAQKLKRCFPDLQIVGSHHGYFDHAGVENGAIIALINALAPDVTFVAFGMPKQELWIHRYQGAINTHVLLSAGACFDYVAGRVRRGPRWMTDHGLEWLARILIEPRRLLWRYTIDNALFGWIVLEQLSRRILRSLLRSRD